MVDIRILEKSHHLKDGIRFSYVRKESVSEPLSLTCSSHNSCDIHEFDRGRHDLQSMHRGLQSRESGIVHIHDTGVRLYRAERKILCIGCIGPGQHIE